MKYLKNLLQLVIHWVEILAGEGSDSSVAQVIDNNSLEQVAKLSKEKITEDEYAEQVVCLAKYYNEALVGIETNFNPYVVNLVAKTRLHKTILA